MISTRLSRIELVPSDQGVLRVSLNVPSDTSSKRSYANGGRAIYRQSRSNPSLSFRGITTAACKLYPRQEAHLGGSLYSLPAKVCTLRTRKPPLFPKAVRPITEAPCKNGKAFSASSSNKSSSPKAGRFTILYSNALSVLNPGTIYTYRT